MVTAVILAMLVMSAIVAIRYVAVSGLFAWITAKKGIERPAVKQGQVRQEIGWSLVAAMIYGAPAGLVMWVWQVHGGTAIYTGWTAMPLWYAPLSVLIYLFAHDTWFYWTHRAMHTRRLFGPMHSVHHASRSPTAWAAMSFHPSEAATGAIVIPLLALIVPIHVSMLALVLTIMTVMGVTNHMGWEIFPRWLVHSRLGEWIITASHHQRHHEHYLCNFGLYFRFWDRLCGTDKGLTRRWGAA